jgi:hypothetical protein
VLAPDASVDDAYGMSEGSDTAAAFAGCSVSMAGLLHQLQSDLCVGSDVCATCIRHLQNSAACFGGVGLDAIPASLLLTNHIAEVGDRAQQCLGLAGQQDGTAAGGGAECFAVMEEVEGLLQLSGQSVLQQLLGGQRLQELVEGLSRCKQQLGDKLQSQNVWYL